MNDGNTLMRQKCPEVTARRRPSVSSCHRRRELCKSSRCDEDVFCVTKPRSDEEQQLFCFITLGHWLIKRAAFGIRATKQNLMETKQTKQPLAVGLDPDRWAHLFSNFCISFFIAVNQRGVALLRGVVSSCCSHFLG